MQLTPDSPVPAPSRQPQGPGTPLGQPHTSSPSRDHTRLLPSTPKLGCGSPHLLPSVFPPRPCLRVCWWVLKQVTKPAMMRLGEDLLAGLLLRPPCCRGMGHLKASAQEETRTDHAPPRPGAEAARCLAAMPLGSFFGGIFTRRCSPTSGRF